MINIEEIQSKGTVCVFIRHGEKDISSYGLTEQGKSEIRRFGQMLYALRKPIMIYSSPEARCMETGLIINGIINGSNPQCVASDILGKPGVQVKDDSLYALLTDTMRCRDIFKEWKRGMHYDAMNTPEYIKEKMLDYFKNTAMLNGITVYVSQSGTVACTGRALGLVDYMDNGDDWVDYLDGYILRW